MSGVWREGGGRVMKKKWKMVNSSHKRIKRTIVNYLQGMVFSKQRVLRDIGGFCNRSKNVGHLKKKTIKEKRRNLFHIASIPHIYFLICDLIISYHFCCSKHLKNTLGLCLLKKKKTELYPPPSLLPAKLEEKQKKLKNKK